MVIRNAYNFCRDHGPFYGRRKDLEKADCEHVPLPYDPKKIDKTKGPRAVYSPVFTKKEFHEKYAKDIVEDYYDNSILEFVRAYTAGHKLDDTEKTELSSYIQNL